MANQSRAETAELAAAAGKFNTGAETLQGTLTALMKELSVTEQYWVGQGGMTFTSVKSKFEAEQKQLFEALKQTAAAIKTSGESYTSTDEEARARLSQMLGEGDGSAIATKDLPL